MSVPAQAQRVVIALSAMVAAGGGLAAVVSRGDPSTDPPACKDPGDHEWCESGNCGTNAPWINTFPINGLRPGGECNYQGVQLMPGSLRGGAAHRCDGHSLEVVGDQLVGVNADGVIQCDDDEIVGASFEVRAYTGSSVRLRIAERVAYAPPAPPSGAQPHVDTRWGYRMVLDVPAGTTTASLCSQAGADAVRAALGLPDKIVAPANVLHDLVIPLDGEVFGSGGRPLGPNGAPRQRQWLQLACVDSALAKRTLYRLTTDNVHRSRAALKMLTASYCGRRAWTLPGIEIAWEDGAPESLEARWGAARASCLGRPRLLERTASPESDLAQLPAELRDVCGGDGKQRCATAADWLTAVRSCVHDAPKKGLVPAAGESWPTFVRRLAAGAYEVEAPRALGPCSAACAGDDCPLEMIPSFVGAR